MNDPYEQPRQHAAPGPDHRYAPAPNQQEPVHWQQQAPAGQPGYGRTRRYALTAAAQFWYIVGNIAFGAMYFAKVPAKKAMAEAGLCDLTGAESFWYVLMCIAFGAGYFAKIPTAKALAELARFE